MPEVHNKALVLSGWLGALLAATILASPSNAQDSDVATTTGGGDANIGYATGDPDTWPAELEATVAAADNHKIVLENDQVRVLEVTLAPGEIEPLHFHRWPSVLYLQQAGDWIDRDADGNVIFDSREVPPMTFPVTLWKGPEAPHSPVNLSDSVEIQLIRVEIKGGAGGSGLMPDSALESEIRAAIAQWVEIYNRNDWALLAGQFTEDAVMMPPNSPTVLGRAAIAAWQTANEDGFRIALMPDEIIVEGARAVVRGRSCVFVPLADGTTGVDVGKFLELRHRQPDGRWLVSHDVFNSNLSDGRDLAPTCPDEIGDGAVRGGGETDANGLPDGSDLMPILDNRTRVILEGIRSGEVSRIMALYEPGSLYSTDNATLLSEPEAIEAFWVNVADSPAHDATLETLRIERLGPDAFVEIQKYDVFDAEGDRLFGGYAMLLWRREGGRWLIAGDVSN